MILLCQQLGKGCEYEESQVGSSGLAGDRFKGKKIRAILVHAMNFNGTTGALVVER